jgi:DNA-binding response OmpR family regulator
MLPSMDGWAVLRRIRAESAVPVIMLTALGEERDRLDGLTMGADDYVVKPFSPREVVARTEAVLRRAGGNPDMAQGDGPLIVGPLEIDSAAHAAALDGEPLDITASEFALLQMLARHTGQALSRESLLEALPQADWDSSERIVDQHVKNLRRKLGTHAHLIGTVRGIGYRFERE